MKNFLIYRSSAGSGKTYTLVKEYLKLVLTDPENIRHTLAVTFTNKAADEMKARIISALIRLSENKDPDLLNQLKDDGVKCDIEASARNVLGIILHNYSYFSVSTIDSFFQRVIRSFSRELNLYTGYSIELDTGIVLDKVVDDVFKDIGDDEDLTKYIVEYVYQNIDEDKGWHVDKNIKSLSAEIFKERYLERKQKKEHDIIDNRDRINEFIELLKKSRYVFENKLIKSANEALEIISSNGLGIDDFKGKKNSAAGYFRKMSVKETYAEVFNIAPYAAAKKILEGSGEWYLKDSPKKSIIDKAVNDGLGRILEDMISYYEANIKKYISVRVLLKTVYTVGIFSDVMEKLKEYRDNNRVLLIPDTNSLLRSVINEESSPFVYEKTGEYYRNFLIDEFQDTSTFQWQNMLPLILNSLSELNFSFVAGDVKQSIYRWRNGNMMLLMSGIESDLVRFRENLQAIDLKKNYRSGKKIIDFNNRLFKIIPGIIAESAETGDTAVIIQAYENVIQEAAGKNKGGFVRADFIEDDDERNLKAHEIAGSRIVETIKEILSEGISPGDILVLARRKTELREVSLLLNSAGIRVVSDESLLLINSPKVKFIVSILKYISGNDDNYAKAEALYNLMLIEDNPDQNPDSIFRDTEVGFEKNIKKRLNDIDTINKSLYGLVENIMLRFGLNEKADPYLMRFLDVVLEYSAAEGREASLFTEWWEENNGEYSIILPGISDAVRLITIHKAKGLESRIVILPYSNWDINISGSRDLIWVSGSEEPFDISSAYLVKASKELKESYFADDYNNEYIMTNLDNLNLLYVALTRARERLYIISPEKGNKTKNINSVLKNAFESDEWFKKLKTADNVYEYGVIEDLKEPIKKDSEVKISVQNVNSGDFRKRTVIKPARENQDFGISGNYSSSRERGILIHKALSKIDTSKDIDHAVLFVKSRGLLNEEYEAALRKELLEILNDKNIAEWFESGKNIKSEKEIITNIPGKTVIRPDRVIINGNKIKLLDYKTGKEKEEDRNQMREYAGIIKSAGYESAETFLYYVENKKLINVK